MGCANPMRIAAAFRAIGARNVMGSDAMQDVLIPAMLIRFGPMLTHIAET